MTEKDRGRQREGERSSICSFTRQMCTMARSRPAEIQTPSASAMLVLGAQALIAACYTLSGNWKVGQPGLEPEFQYGKWVSQMVTQLTLPCLPQASQCFCRVPYFSHEEGAVTVLVLDMRQLRHREMKWIIVSGETGKSWECWLLAPEFIYPWAWSISTLQS